MTITGHVENFESVQAAFDSLSAGLSDFKPLFEKVGKLFYEFESDAFKTEGRSSAAGRWAPLSRNYAQYKNIARPGQPLLRFDDDLMESLTTPNAPGSIYEVLEQEASFGTKDKKAIWHQLGTRKMPARPVLALTDYQVYQMSLLISNGLVELARRSSFHLPERTQ